MLPTAVFNMWRTAAGCVAVILAILLNVQAADRASKRIADASSEFSVELLKTLLKQSKGNAVIAPLSVSTLLAMLQQGAENSTKTQLENVLHTTKEESREGYGHIIRSLKMRKSKSTLEFGSSVFLNNEFEMAPEYKDILLDDFHANIELINFKHSQDAAKQINKWVSQITKNRIPELVSSDEISPRMQLVLTSAVYFKGVWTRTFNPNKTYTGKFSPELGIDITIPIMHQVGRFRAGEDRSLGAKWVELPFDGDEFSMVLVLPSEKHGLDALLEKMTARDLSNMLNTRKTKQVILDLPRFKLAGGTSLISVLEKLGVTNIFHAEADLRGISDTKGTLMVSDIIHKAEIEINEEGGSASAASGILVNTLSLMPYADDLTFIADQPFLAIIVDRVNSVPLFTGRITDPHTS
ncbi:ipis-1 [Anabrus simplex]|uniref:ipis-1 n=1 Tax=Anabrus simplex TaxID=316456 RepID=UPI0034DD0764